MTTPNTSIVLRPLTTEAEFRACVQLQREIWGDDYGELVPPIILQIAQKVGGVAVGAFTPDQVLQGFVFGITGVRDGRLVHWSHILAVRPELRDAGLGRRLKEHQRDLLLPLGVETIYWTFDPLVAKNAHFNLNRLGAEVVEYVVDMYGRTLSPLHILGTDRLVVAWHIGGGQGTPARARALARFDSHSDARSDSDTGACPDSDTGAHFGSDTLAHSSPGPVARSAAHTTQIEIPADLDLLLCTDPELARRWQAEVRRSFLHYLGAGYTVTAFERASDDGRCFYHLSATAIVDPGGDRDDAGGAGAMIGGATGNSPDDTTTEPTEQ